MTVYPSFSVLPPAKTYGVIYADPSWRFKTFAPPKEDAKGRRDVERHYPTMTLDEIKAIPVRDIAAKNAWLMMWCTWPFLEHGLATMRAWGFSYSSSFKVWFKMKKGFSETREFITLPRDAHMGTGYTTRKNTEFILLGRRGSPKRILINGKRDTILEPIFAPVREHSRKPDGVIDEIMRFAPGPYIELNARTARDGWDQWGNQVGKFEAPALPVLTMVEPPARQVELFQIAGSQ
ncbi:MAG: hypothetical protein KKA05_10505 [Alphaproteobacteria bacterium]|nr:hypothetical protein [Alphaproteobacteria bacterium]